MTDNIEVVIHTDGSCLGNPGAGGWAAILRYGGREKEISGGEANTTNNRMELLAVIMALETLKRRVKVQVISDSNYMKDVITKWIKKWKQNGWKTAAKKPVANQDLWQRLDAAAASHDVVWHWVKGHAGDEMNERCDDLAREQAEKMRG